MSTFVIVIQLITDRFAEEILIDFQEIIGEHSGENLAHAVWQTLKLFSLKGHVSTYLLPASYAIILIPHRLLLLTATMLQTMTP